MKSGMKSAPPGFEEIADELGDKVTAGLAGAVAKTREDLASYRNDHASWVTESSERGLANWIHDRLWSNLQRVFEPLPDVVAWERGVVREVIVQSRFRIRIKRHHMNGEVRSYPTQTALDFYDQGPGGKQNVQLRLAGMEEICLSAGYRWDAELRTIGSAVLSLRSSRSVPYWVVDLAEPTQTVTVPGHSNDGPSRPQVKPGKHLGASTDQTKDDGP